MRTVPYFVPEVQLSCQIFDVYVVGEGAEGVVVTALRDGWSLRRKE